MNNVSTLSSTLKWRTNVQSSDIVNVCALTEATGVFSREEVAVAGELVEEKLLKDDASTYQFVFAENNEGLVGYACFGEIPFTQHRFDLYWIAVSPKIQKKGLGADLLHRTEQSIAKQGGVAIYADTSGRFIYEPTRKFYIRNGFLKVADLPNYYADGDSKLSYCKHLK